MQLFPGAAAIGVGAVVRDFVQIGSNIVVGAGAVVVKDLLEPGTYVGCPARLLTHNQRAVLFNLE